MLSAAAEAFASQPYEHVSMAEVAAQANASEALLYRYFGSKPRLYAEVLRAAAAEIVARQKASVRALGRAAAIRDKLTAVVNGYLDYLAGATPQWSSAIVSARADPAELADLRDQLREERLAELRELIDLSGVSDYAIYGFLGFLDAACLVWIERGQRVTDRPQLGTAAVNALLASTPEVHLDSGRHSKFRR